MHPDIHPLWRDTSNFTHRFIGIAVTARYVPTQDPAAGQRSVEDFDRWWSVFSTTSLEKRKQHGSKGSHVFRDPNEEGRVWAIFDWDEAGWQSFLSDPEVPAILQEAGHASRPQMAEPAGQLDG